MPGAALSELVQHLSPIECQDDLGEPRLTVTGHVRAFRSVTDRTRNGAPRGLWWSLNIPIGRWHARHPVYYTRVCGDAGVNNLLCCQSCKTPTARASWAHAIMYGTQYLIIIQKDCVNQYLVDYAFYRYGTFFLPINVCCGPAAVLPQSSLITPSIYWVFNPHLRMCSLILETKEGRERETSMWERNINQLPLIHDPTRDQTHTPGMCSDQEPNLWPFGVYQHSVGIYTNIHQHSNQLSHLARAYSWFVLFICLVVWNRSRARALETDG